jgi:formate dehydrogenase subunit gamma
MTMIAYWLRDMRLTRGDWAWLGPKFVDYLRRRGAADPTTGKYNGGQKLFFYLVALLAFVLLATGVVLWFPSSFSAPLRQVSWTIHDVAFLAFAVAIVGHIYLGTAALPGTFRSMTRGTVTKAWAKMHHPRWYRDVTGERGDPANGAGSAGAGVHDVQK